MIVSENIGPEWKNFASKGLELSAEEIAFVDSTTDRSVPHEQCWEVLHRWRQRIPSSNLTKRLADALHATKNHRLADIVEQARSTRGHIDDVLSPHADREG